MITTRAQEVYLKEIDNYMRGWSLPLKDKTLKNDLVDVESINFPKDLEESNDLGIE